MNNKKLFVYAAIPVLGLALVGGVRTASAHGFFGGIKNASPEEIATRQTAMFEQHAQLLGLSVDAVKTAWAEGKTIKDLAAASGLTQDQLHAKMKAAGLAQLKAQLDTLVGKGVITQAQADKRYEVMSTKVEHRKRMR